MMMNTVVWTGCLLLALLMTPVWAAESSTTEEENMILSLVLKHPSRGGAYTVVAPRTKLFGLTEDPEAVKQHKKHLVEHFKADNTVVRRLIDKLFERNSRSVRLSINSSPENGYLVDYESVYAKYFEPGGGGWERWRKEHPKAQGYTTVSLPAYDPQSGLLLIYMGTQSNWLAGSGWILLCKYDKGELQKLDKVMLWIS